MTRGVVRVPAECPVGSLAAWWGTGHSSAGPWVACPAPLPTTLAPSARAAAGLGLEAGDGAGEAGGGARGGAWRLWPERCTPGVVVRRTSCRMRGREPRQMERARFPAPLPLLGPRPKLSSLGAPS